MKTALVFGGSGQIGQPLLLRLQQNGWRVLALSRNAHDAADDGPVRWLPGSFAQMPPLPLFVDAVFSCGPLDAFAHWYAQTSLRTAGIVAFSSTSAEVKSGSSDAGERALAERLNEAEQRLFAAAGLRGARCVVLRPTLIYGSGRDQTLSRIVTLARRWRGFALPNTARGLRQPVHVDDLADVALRAESASRIRAATYAVAGGETVPYADMVARVLDCLESPPRFATLPTPIFRLLLRVAQMQGFARDLAPAVLERMREDLVFDLGPAQRDLGYQPRPFAPEAAMFESPPAPLGADAAQTVPSGSGKDDDAQVDADARDEADQASDTGNKKAPRQG